MTRYPKRQPITRERTGRLRNAAATVMGSALERVGYRFPVDVHWPQDYERGQLDEVDMAVALAFSSGTSLLISWAMDGFAEGIDAEAGPTGVLAVVPDRQCEFEASEAGPWSELVGDVLSGVGATWQLRSEYAPQTAWAVRLMFASGRVVVIALGEVRDRVVDYQPDGLVVFFDEDEADAYREAYESQGGGVPSSWEAVVTAASDRMRPSAESS